MIQLFVIAIKIRLNLTGVSYTCTGSINKKRIKLTYELTTYIRCIITIFYNGNSSTFLIHL